MSEGSIGTILAPLPVAIPLLCAAIISAIGRHVPRWIVDAIAIVASTSVTIVALVLMQLASSGTIVEWLGGFQPRHGIAIGIELAVDPVGAGVGALSGLLVTMSLVHSLRYFESAGSLFQALMLVFLAALSGFGLTADLFNLFVFFELMSATAFALAGYESKESGPLQGALNFGITNTIGAFLVLIGIALLYGRTGALNMAQIGRTLEAADPLVAAAFAFIVCGFAVKAALVPFHFWLSDAHAVAPSPVSAIFSGVMVEAPLYAIGRIHTVIFADVLAGHAGLVRALLLGLGMLTAVVGPLFALMQRHLKRLLAFSTIGHMGTAMIGLGLLSEDGFRAAAYYAAGHGLVKAALFLLAGILLHRFETIDEIQLKGKGQLIPRTGLLFALGTLALGGLFPFAPGVGHAAIDEAASALDLGFLAIFTTFNAAVTTAALARFIGRVFLDLGPADAALPTIGASSESSETGGPHGVVPWSMILPAIVLLAAAIVLVPFSGLSSTRGVAVNLGSLAVGIGLAAIALDRRRLPEGILSAGRFLDARVVEPLRELQSGHAGDYVAWLIFGVAVFGSAALIAIR